MKSVLLSLLVMIGCGGPRTMFVAPVASMPLLVAHAHTADLSAGDPLRGRAAFIALQCHACHRVAEDDTLPEVEGGWDGPVLENLGAQPPEAVAWKIVAKGELSAEALYDTPMADAASGITDRQLIDLVAYLRNPAAAKKSER
jgi:mono/diheme cytochrome c family protein